MHKLASVIMLASIYHFGLSTTIYGKSSTGWLCISEKATGFKYDKSTKEWRPTNFNVSLEKFLVRPRTPDDLDLLGMVNPGDDAWSVAEIGRDIGYAWRGFNEYNVLYCEGIGSEFTFSKQNLKFQDYHIRWVVFRPRKHGFSVHYYWALYVTMRPNDSTLWLFRNSQSMSESASRTSRRFLPDRSSASDNVPWPRGMCLPSVRSRVRRISPPRRPVGYCSGRSTLRCRYLPPPCRPRPGKFPRPAAILLSQ
jgi:hypothetical protein